MDKYIEKMSYSKPTCKCFEDKLEKENLIGGGIVYKDIRVGFATRFNRTNDTFVTESIWLDNKHCPQCGAKYEEINK